MRPEVTRALDNELSFIKDGALGFSIELMEEFEWELPLNVIEAYRDETRHYHTLAHIEEILLLINELQDDDYYSLSRKDIFLLHLIAWYHDLVYIPGDRKNEHDSGFAFVKDSEAMEALSIDDETLVYEAILDTKSHDEPSSWLSALFMDLDLAALGSDPDMYSYNYFLIKQEFDKFAEEEWLEGRIEFLSRLLSRTMIYHTSFGALWERQARDNMATELENCQVALNRIKLNKLNPTDDEPALVELFWKESRSGYLPPRTMRSIIKNPDDHDASLVEACWDWFLSQ